MVSRPFYCTLWTVSLQVFSTAPQPLRSPNPTPARRTGGRQPSNEDVSVGKSEVPNIPKDAAPCNPSSTCNHPPSSVSFRTRKTWSCETDAVPIAASNLLIAQSSDCPLSNLADFFRSAKLGRPLFGRSKTPGRSFSRKTPRRESLGTTGRFTWLGRLGTLGPWRSSKRWFANSQNESLHLVTSKRSWPFRDRQHETDHEKNN